MDEKEHIRRAHFLQGSSIREIAREMHHSRKTVRKAISDASPPVYTRTAPVEEPVIGPVRQTIERWLAEDKDRPRKQRHTAHRVYERLRDEHGFAGGESTVRRFVASLRRRNVEHFVPLIFDPGADAQVDFGEAYVEMDGCERKVHLFEMRLSYSRRPFVMALPFTKQEALLEGHVRAFEFYGGVPGRISYDNMTTATHRALRGDQRRESDAFIAFRSHYLFESHFCNPYRAHEKGQIEGQVGYSRRNWLVPLPKVKDFDELNAYLVGKCLDEEHRVVSGMKRSIGEMFDEEKPHLLPLPPRRYECFRLHPVRSNKMGIITFEGNSYSVPEEHASKSLFVKAYVEKLVVTDEKRVVSTKRRLYGKGEEDLAVGDYLDVLAKKPGAVEYARPLKVSEFAPVYSRFLSQLKEKLPEDTARREFVKVLSLEASHPEWAVARAMEMALGCGTLDVEAVKSFLLRSDEESSRPGALDLPETVPHVSVAVRDLAEYDRLLSGVAI